MSLPDPRSVTRLSPTQFRIRYALALVVIAVLCILAQSVLQRMLESGDARLVNAAGRLRFLSERVAHLGTEAALGSPSAAPDARRRLGLALDQWERAHDTLRRGDPPTGIPAPAGTDRPSLFERAEAPRSAMSSAARELLQPPSRKGASEAVLARLRDSQAAYVAVVEDIVSRYESEANDRIANARRAGIALAGLMLLVLLAQALFIFAPAARRMRLDMESHDEYEKDLEQLFAVSPTAMLLIDNDNLTILRANRKAIELIGLPEDEVEGRSLKEHIDSDHEANRSFLERVGQHKVMHEYEVVLLDARRSVLESLVSVRETTFAGRSVSVLGISDVTEIKKAQQTLEGYATYDEFTGLVNRRTGLMMLDKSAVRSKRDGIRLTACCVSIDGIEATASFFGVGACDWTIRTVAQLLTGAIRLSDVAVRLGRDTFLVLLHDCSAEDAARLLGRVEERLGDIEHEEDTPFHLAISFGIVTYDAARHASANDLLDAAEAVMAKARQDKKTPTEKA